MEQLAASLKIALICEEKLRDPARAFATLCEALPADPAGRELLPNLERLADQTKDWRGLLDVYARVARARTEVGGACRAAAAARRRARAQDVGSVGRARRDAAQLRAAPESPSTQEEILRLARATGRWEEAIRVEGHLFALAETLPEKLEIARNAAYLVEHEVKDLVRAFRAYLNAFRLAPDDSEIVGHLWRLAASIGTLSRLPRGRAGRRGGAGGASRAAVASATSADDGTAAGATSDEDDDIDVDVDDEMDEIEAPASSANGEARHADAAPLRPTKAMRSSTPPPVAVDELDPNTSGSIRADDAIVEEEAAEEAGDADVIEELDAEDAELLEATPPPQPMAARPPAPPPLNRAPRRSRKKTSSSRRPGKSWPTRTTRSPPRTPTPAASTCARSSRCGSSDRRTSTAPWARWNARSGSTSRTGRSARELERVGGQYDRWDRVVEIYLGAIDEFGPIDTAVALHHDAARLRERLGQTDKAEALYDEILRLKSDDEVALARVEEIFREQQRWEDLANVLEKRTSAPTEALPLGPERRASGCASWRRCTRSGWSGRTRRSTRWSACSSRWPTRSGATARRRRPQRTSRCCGAHEALVRLYSRVGLWGKVVDSLKRQAELTTDRQRARALRLRGRGACTRRSWPSPSAPPRPTRRSSRRIPTTRRRWRRSIA